MIIAIDFDGTLHDGEFPNIGAPLDGATEYVNKLKNDNHYIIIWTCRNAERLTEAINWLIEQNIPFDRVNDHEPESKRKYKSDSRKVYAHLYVDDKQVGGLPSWKYIYKYASEMEAKYQKGISHEHTT